MKSTSSKPNPYSREAPYPRRRRRHAFSLIEILIVIAIISVLAAIVIGAASAMKENAREQRTKASLQALAGIASEYRASTRFHVNHLKSDANAAQGDEDWSLSKPFNAPDASGSGEVDDSIERFVLKALQLESSGTMVRALQGDALIDSDGDGFLEVVDGWGNKIEYAKYVDHEDADDSDNFLPQRGTRYNPQPYFASAGGDGEFGDAESTPSPDGTVRQDNLYSYSIEGRSFEQ